MDNKTLQEIRDILARIERKVDALGRENARDVHAFSTWLSQYEPEEDISEEPEPYIPVAACSEEDVMRALEKHGKWEEKKKKYPEETSMMEQKP